MTWMLERDDEDAGAPSHRPNKPPADDPRRSTACGPPAPARACTERRQGTLPAPPCCELQLGPWIRPARMIGWSGDPGRRRRGTACRAGMAACKPCSTPVDLNLKLSAGDPISDPTDIAYAVQQVCLHMHDPREPHLAALKRILRYVRGTLDLGLHLRASSQTELVVYSDADWAGCPDTRKSTSGYAVLLGDNLVS